LQGSEYTSQLDFESFQLLSLTIQIGFDGATIAMHWKYGLKEPRNPTT